MVANVASECGYTPQYQQWQELYEEFKDSLVIVGFPCHAFGGQEAGSNEEIKELCTVKNLSPPALALFMRRSWNG